MLERIRDNLTSDCANSIYTAYIRRIMDYCDTMWKSCKVGNSSSLERLQRRAAKIVSKTGESERALDYRKWPSLVNRGESHVNELVKRCIKGQYPQFFKDYFTYNSSVHNRITTKLNMSHLLRFRTDLAKYSFYYHSSVILNTLNF